MSAAFLLFLSGCASIPNSITPGSQRLEPQKLNAGNAIRAAGNQPVPWPSAQWWKAYGDPQLDRMVAEALSGNPAMHIAQARIAKVQALSGIARSALLPSIDVDAAFSRQRYSEYHYNPSALAGNWEWNNGATADLSYNLDVWGKNRAALAASLDAVQVGRAEAQEVQLALETAVVRAYVRLSLQCVLEDVAKATLQKRQEILDITRKRYAAGLATELDLSQAETPLPAARAELERISESIELLHNELTALTGKGPGDGEGIRRPSLSFDLPVGLPAVLPAELLGRRPDVVAQRWRVEAAGKGIEVAKAAFYPNINLTAFAGIQSIGFAQFLSPGSLIAGFTPAVSLPVFNGGRLRSELGASTADYDIAVDSYNGTLVRALEEVADQVVTLRSLEKQRGQAKQSYALAHRAYDIALKSFRKGLSEYLNVLNAQNQTLVESQRKAQVEARFLDAYAGLMHSIGGGVPVTPPAPGGAK
ncbi:efflux transporter outer membrane subunit [Geomonas sp. Red32]|uniref:efflux transporter outer membrane subunit n=1 Tax=Geomonas sp. Red32 TaxID=2912856 RepID=UPI00202CF8E9|nr:efflux transporter outer membrane subunit [Geomonas sp. Red32]MCM0084366.1 efflux transporter outer membrane subunit [Geomonas sp. Red32]